MNIDLLNRYNNIIDEYGYDILLISQNRKRRCSCWDEKTQSADRKCPFCYGLGSVPTIQKHRVRDIDREIYPVSSINTNIGDLLISKRAYFFRNDMKIQENDLIVDVEWENGRPIYTDGGIYEVNHIDPQRFRNGELIFQKVYVKDNPIYKSIRGIKIVEDAGKIFYEIAEDKK